MSEHRNRLCLSILFPDHKNASYFYLKLYLHIRHALNCCCLLWWNHFNYGFEFPGHTLDLGSNEFFSVFQNSTHKPCTICCLNFVSKSDIIKCLFWEVDCVVMLGDLIVGQRTLIELDVTHNSVLIKNQASNINSGIEFFSLFCCTIIRLFLVLEILYVTLLSHWKLFLLEVTLVNHVIGSNRKYLEGIIWLSQHS